MFDIFKRAAHLSHIELCGLVLSSRPLADGQFELGASAYEKRGVAVVVPHWDETKCCLLYTSGNTSSSGLSTAEEESIHSWLVTKCNMLDGYVSRANSAVSTYRCV